MTLRTKVGGVTGSKQSPILLVTAFDDAHGTLVYNDALAAAIAACPATIFNAQLKISEVQIAEKSRDAITFEVGYVGPGRNILLLGTQSQTKSKKMFHFIDTVGVYTDGTGTNNGSSWSQMKYKLDRINSSSEFNSGKPITVEPKTDSVRQWNFQTSQSFLTDAYLDLVDDYVRRGVFNVATFLGRAAATHQIVSFSAQQRDLQEWELNFGISYTKPETDVFVDGTIKIPTLRGCDYYWLLEKPDDVDGKIQPKVQAAFVGQVWPLGDFTKLNLPFQGSLTTRSSATQGAVTTLYDHGFTASDDLIVYWDGGRAFADITSASTLGIAFNYNTPATGLPARGGDSLPPLGTNVLVAKQVAP